ncbi:MAG: VWA domain-containing protein [Verrucomicrobia bacterium]|jgi:Ca-activated chloride channel homolog|nr:VWA domain-containing protein [Verrucomicrobiota bacterium]
MNFLSPYAFWLAVTLPIVVLFYLLKRRRKVQVVASSMLWRKFLAETQASAPFQKLRHHWLLVFQLLMLALAVLAMTRPFFSGKVSEGGLLVVIMDTSASMQSTDVSPNRMDAAIKEAGVLIDTLSDSDQMMILAAGRQTQVLQSATSEKTELRRALSGIQSSDTSTYLLDAFKLAQTLVKDQKLAEIHLFSDGAASDLNEFESTDLNVNYHPIGERAYNVGIVSMDVRPNPDDQSTRALFAGIVNYSTNRLDLIAELKWNDQTIEARSLNLAPGSTDSQAFIAPQSENGIFTLKLNTEDDLSVDNQASVVSLLPKPVRTLLVTRGNRFLEKALNAARNIELAVVDQFSETSPDVDLVVLDDVIPLTWPTGNTLAIHVTHTNWFSEVSIADSPVIVDWKAAHPLMRFVQLDDVQIAETLGIKTPDWAMSIVESTSTPLILAGEKEGQRMVWAGFDTLQSTWPLRVSFPIFIANAVEWLNPSTSQASMVNVRTGEALVATLDKPDPSLSMVLPDGETTRLKSLPDSRQIIFANTLKQGIYRLKNGTNEVVFASNLIDASESDNGPREELNLGGYQQVAGTGQQRANLEMWRWLVFAAFCVLMFEWWYYHKRTA